MTMRLRPVWAYVDDRVDAIPAAVSELRDAGPDQAQQAYAEIQDSVTAQVVQMADEVLQQTAVSVVDDLYTFAFGATSIGSVHCAYVGAVCQPLTEELTARGFAVHYIAVVPPTDRETLAADRLEGFRDLYRSAGLVYLSPLAFSLELMAADGARGSGSAATAEEYLAEARLLCERAVQVARAAGHHFMLHGTGGDGPSFSAEVMAGARPGELLMFRDQAPIPGSRILVRLPKGPGGDALG